MIDGALASWDGWWWPVADFEARPVITYDCLPAIAALLPHIRGRDCIVQAGGNVGLYPIALTDHFRSVVTCEPDETNYACLSRNVQARDSLKRITMLKAAFGEREGGCKPVVVESGNCGAHRVSFSEGETPVWTIDGLELAACDCIWLDCEGSELFALKGAADTIEKFSPTIAVEDKGLDARFFGVARGALQAWLGERGYEEVARIGRDKVFRKVTT